MEEKTYLSAGGAVHYWLQRRGNGEQLWLVFLHGLLADHTLFEKQVGHFAAGYSVLVWDAPAHGCSRPYAPFSIAAAAADLRAILEREGIESCVLIGQSMGGFVAQAFLQRWPETVRAFVGVDTCPCGAEYYSRSDRWWLRQVGWMARLYPDGFLRRSIEKGCSRTEYGRENMRAAMARYSKAELCRLMGAGYAAMLDGGTCTPDCPVLLILGEHDRIGKVRQYCELWHERCGYPLEVIPGAAHNANVDAWQRVNETIENFLKEVPGT